MFCEAEAIFKVPCRRVYGHIKPGDALKGFIYVAVVVTAVQTHLTREQCNTWMRGFIRGVITATLLHASRANTN